MTLTLLRCPGTAGAIQLERRGAPPCTLFVTDEEVVSGCDEVSPGSDEDLLLSAAAGQAVSALRAWRKRTTRQLFSETTSGSADSIGLEQRAAISRDLNREFDGTVAIQTMQATIMADSVTYADGSLHTLYRITRTVPSGRDRPSLEVYWVCYEEAWQRGEEGWRLARIERVDAGRWRPPDALPLVSPPERFASDVRVSTQGRGSADVSRATQRPYPQTVRVGEMIGPFGADCRGPGASFVTQQALPVRRVEPVYPEDGGIGPHRVVLEAWVCGDGQVEYIRVKSGEPSFAAAAVRAVREWRFIPAKSQGETVSAWFELPILFDR